MKKILLTPRAFHNYGQHAIDLIKEHGYEPIVNDTGRQLSKEEFSKLAKESHGIVIGVDLLEKDLISECEDLKAVVKFGVGTDNIDVEFAEQRGISVGRTVGSNSTSVAEFTIALMFACARKVVESSNIVKKGGWTKLTGMELKNKTIGIVGFGNIGKEVARISKGIGMNVLVYDAFPINEEVLNDYQVEYSELNNLLVQSDFITLHVPLTESTENLISDSEFQLMKNDACLINIARGGIVDEKGLLKALKDKQIASAAADVFTTEPPENTGWVAELLDLDNFILTPHIGSRTVDSEINTINMSVEILLEYLENKVLSPVK